MGAGKTTIGALLAERSGRPFIDSDPQLRRLTGHTGKEIAAAEGVERLHRLESEALHDALSSPGPAVIAAAASIADDEGALSAVKRSRALVVMLEADPETLAARALTGDHRRGVTRDELVSLSESRRLALLDLSPVAVVDTSRQSPAATVEEILRQARPFMEGLTGDQRG
jgi:shikimate kinase